jgi:hypothetical protein
MGNEKSIILNNEKPLGRIHNLDRTLTEEFYEDFVKNLITCFTHGRACARPTRLGVHFLGSQARKPL